MADTDISLDLDFDIAPAQKTADELRSKLQRIFNDVSDVKLSRSLDTTVTKMKNVVKESEEISKKISEFPKGEIEIETKGYREASDQYDALTRKIQEATWAQEDIMADNMNLVNFDDSAASLEKLRTFLQEYNKDYQTLATQISEAKLQQDALVESMDAMMEAGTITQINPEYQALAESQEQLNNKMTEGAHVIESSAAYQSVYDNALAQTTQELGNNVTAILEEEAAQKQAEAQTQAMGEAFKLLHIEMTTAHPVLMKVAEGVYKVVQSVGQFVGMAAHKAFDLLKTAIGGVVDGAKKLAGAAIHKSIDMLKKAASGAAGVVKNLGSRLLGLSSSGKSFGNSMLGSVKNLILAGIGVRSLSAAFMKLRSAVTEGITNLAKVPGIGAATNAALSSLQTSLAYLKNSWGAAFAPVLTVVAPILSRLIDMIATVANIIASFFAALTGATSFIAGKKSPVKFGAGGAGGGGGNKKQSIEEKNKKIQEDNAKRQAKAEEKYQKQLEKVEGKRANAAAKAEAKEAKAADKLAKSQKEANAGLAEFDELNVLTTNDAEDAADAMDDFSIPEFEDPAFEMPNLKELLTDDLTGGGGGGGGLSGLFEELDIPQWVKDFVDKLKEAWAMGDFTEIGTILGTKLKEGLDSIDWAPIQSTASKIGHSLATLINGFVEVQGLGYSIGRTIGEAINTGLAFANEFLDTTHWDSIGKFIGDGINGMFNTIDWPGLGHFFAQKFNALFEVLGGVAETVDWSNIGVELATSISSFLSDMNWGENAESLSNFINGLLEALIVVIQQTDWTKLGNGLAETLNGIDWYSLIVNLFTGAGAIIEGLLDAIITFFESADWYALGDSLVHGFIDGVAAVDWSSVASKIFELLGAALGAALGLVYGFLDDILTQVGDYISEKFGEILESDGSWAEKGIMIIQGIFEGIIEILATVGTWIYENVFTPFIEGFKAAFGIASPSKEMKPLGENIINGMFEGILNIFKNIGPWIKEHIFDPIVNKIVELFQLDGGRSEVLFEKGIEIALGIIQAVEEKAEDLLKPWKEFKDGVVKFFEDMKKKVEEKFKGMVDKVLDLGQQVKDFVGGIWDSISGTVEDIGNGISGAWDSATNFVGGGLKQLGGAIGIPGLASGAVIPANTPFLAILGDQKSGVNVETPLSTMIDAFNSALNMRENISGSISGEYESTVVSLLQQLVDKDIIVNDVQLFKTIRKVARQVNSATGMQPFVY